MTKKGDSEGLCAKDQSLRASIIIVNYNGGIKIVQCLRSVFGLIEAGTEVIVVDNASSDGSAETIEASFPDLRLIRAGENLGFGAGNNLGAAQANGRYIVFLNPDTVVCGHWLSKMLGVLDEDQEAGLVTPKILMAGDPDLINACGNRIHLTGLTLCRGLKAPSQSFSSAEEVDAVSGAAFAIRHSLFDELDGFDEDMFLYVEDTDLSLRARLAGWHCIYTPDSQVQHDYRLKITPLKIFYQERNRHLMLLKTFRWATLAVLLPAQFAAECISWGFVLTADRRNIGNKVKAYQWIFSNRSRILEKRREVQALRKVPDRQLLRGTAIKLDFGQAAPAGIASLAHIVFDPFFFLMKALVMVIVWW
jgi:GT2 family glycosyltransferase